jgi:hypothetical protein
MAKGTSRKLRQGPGEQGLAAARGPDEKDVALLQFHFVRPGVGRLGHVFRAVFAWDGRRIGNDALVVVVDRDREGSLGAFLANAVLVQMPLDVRRLGDGQTGSRLAGLRPAIPCPGPVCRPRRRSRRCRPRDRRSAFFTSAWDFPQKLHIVSWVGRATRIRWASTAGGLVVLGRRFPCGISRRRPPGRSPWLPRRT